ncbi:hypothetical protein E1293_40775 [Actinomadura darangshiensis]|uniref:Tyr recombinase domain-containing protein n=1 Tax=Actinomadura darangshiensis TaxID=705336 RepID=A0A4R5A301_9ACTN|nr:hypothetical protein E1293_40775 [Actinomadura darangshiensis]
MLDTVTGDRLEIAIMIALAYGPRRGEVLGLHWSSLDWYAGTVRLIKTPKSRRTLVLTPQIVATLRARRSEAKIAAGELWKDHGLIFASEVDTPGPGELPAHHLQAGQACGPGH